MNQIWNYLLILDFFVDMNDNFSDGEKELSKEL